MGGEMSASARFGVGRRLVQGPFRGLQKDDSALQADCDGVSAIIGAKF
jgi:hypothetical protein